MTDIHLVFKACCVIHNMLIDFYGLDDWEQLERFRNDPNEEEYLHAVEENIDGADRDVLGMMPRAVIRERRRLNGNAGDDSIFDFDAEEEMGEVNDENNIEELERYHERRRRLIDHYEYMKENYRIRM